MHFVAVFTGQETEAACSTNINEQLSIDNLKIVNKECSKAAKDWFSIGLELDVPADTLNVIEEDHKANVRRCLLEVLSCWLNSSNDRTWKVLADAMGCETVGRSDIKDHILKYHV